MKSAFNIETQTTAATEWEFTKQQQRQREYAESFQCERIFQWRDIRGNVNTLPQYVKVAILEAGYVPVFLGGTTFKYSVIGLTKQPESVIRYHATAKAWSSNPVVAKASREVSIMLQESLSANEIIASEAYRTLTAEVANA